MVFVEHTLKPFYYTSTLPLRNPKKRPSKPCFRAAAVLGRHCKHTWCVSWRSYVRRSTGSEAPPLRGSLGAGKGHAPDPWC